MTANKADLDAALTAVQAAVSTLVADQAAAFKRLEDLIAGGGTGGDLQAEVDTLKTIGDALAAAAGAAEKEGVPTPPPPPPAA